MNRNLLKALPIPLLLLAGAGAALAQGFEYDPECWDPSSTTHYSNDFNSYNVGNLLFGAGVGVSGTVTYLKGLCIPDTGNTAVPVIGRFGFTIGSVGSIQDTGVFKDDFLRLTWGMNDFSGGAQSGSGYSFARIQIQDQNGVPAADQRFGGVAFRLAFVGASDRYTYTEQTSGTVDTRLLIDVIGDAARMRWRLTNIGTVPQRLGLWVGQMMILTTFTPSDTFPTDVQNLTPYITIPGHKPLSIDQRFIRINDPTGFPNKVNVSWNQKDAYGLQIVNGPTPETLSANGLSSDQTPVDEFVLGDGTHILNGYSGGVADPKFGDFTFPDATFNTGVTGPAYIQKWQPQIVSPVIAGDPNSGFRDITTYYRSTSGNANYSRPYAVVVDAPKVLGADSNDPNLLSPTPFTVRVYVDNTFGFSSVDKEIPLNDVKVTLTLPQGLSDGNDATKTVITKFINVVAPKQISWIDFPVQVDPTVNGELTYQVKIEPNPGTNKTLTGTILAATTPRLLIRDQANLVTTPFHFSDPSWETVLSPLRVDQDFQVFAWDPVTKAYVIQTQPQRGVGSWVVSTVDLGYKVLQGNPIAPTNEFPDPIKVVFGDPVDGPPLLQLKSGWNLIGNPNRYPIPLGQIVGVTQTNPTQAFTFQELVQQGILSGSLAFWDQDVQTYKYINGLDAKMLPDRGYWIFVTTQQDVTLSFPVVYEPFARAAAKAWTQSDKQWRLQLAARGANGIDDQNYVGKVANATIAKALRSFEPPVAPIKGAISAYITDTVDGNQTSLSQDLSDKTGNFAWTFKVDNKEAGPITVTWPNITTVPKGYRFRITDTATGATRDMRKTSGYTFTAAERTTRTFTIDAVPGVASAPTIGAITVSRTSKDANSPLSIAYTLASDATTTIRILQGNSREVYVPRRNRADKAGQNSVVWNQRDAANRTVPPGVYNVEITAEGQDGERVRRIFPVTIIR